MPQSNNENPPGSGRGDVTPNQDYLQEWDEYQRDSKRTLPILLPISVNMKKGQIVRHRITAKKLSGLQKQLMTEFKAHCTSPPGELAQKYMAKHFEDMLDDYIDFFEDDFDEGPVPPTPLDLKINRPVRSLYHLARKSWTFTEERQFSTENDRDDFGRNFEKITTFDNYNYLLLANHCRSTPKGLKFNLHITITQTENKQTFKTPIIIDPGAGNDDRTGGGQQGLP